MDVFLLLVMATSGLCVVSSHVGRQYHFVYELKTMTEAQRYCREKHTDLATIDNMEDVKTLNDVADPRRMKTSKYGFRAWIGLYYDLNSWRWSLSDTRFYKHGEADFRTWSSGEPNNLIGREYCALMAPQGLWRDLRCDSHLPAVCFDVRGSNVNFVLINNLMNWTDAQRYCREHHTDLASVRNMAENQKVRLVAAGQDVWIGLFRDLWKWSDGSLSSFKYWRQEPNKSDREQQKEACVAANFGQSGKWENFNCDTKRAFICYSAVPVSKQMVKVRVKKSSSVDLNDPAVMEDILMQLRQKLKDQGVTGDVKLSWRKQSDGKVFHKEEKKKRSATAKKDEL